MPSSDSPLAANQNLERLALILLFFAILAVYLYTIGPTVTGEDSGELAAAAYVLGVPHPPGYPTWTLLGYVATVVVPFGSVAWKVAAASAACAALTSILLYKLLRIIALPASAALCGAIMFALSREHWRQGTIAEVYSLTGLVFVACLLCLVHWHQSQRHHDLRFLALLLGLGMGVHNTIALVAPVFAGFVLCVNPRAIRDWRLMLQLLALFLLGLATHLYLPLRALADPAINWGDPDSWDRFWAVVSREQYGLGVLTKPRTVARYLAQLSTLGSLYRSEFTLALAWLPLVGIYALYRKNLALLALLGTTLVACTLVFVFLMNMEIDQQGRWLNNVYFIPAYLLTSALSAIGFHSLILRLKPHPNLQRVAYLLLFGAIFLLAARNAPAVSKREYHFAADFARNILKTLEPDALYFPTSDHATFPVLYLQIVEGARPDVTVANKYGYTEASLYATMDAATRTAMAEIPADRRDAAYENWIIANSTRPVYFSTPRDMRALRGYRLQDTGLLYRVIRPSERFTPPDLWSEYSWHTLDAADTQGEMTACYVLSDYHFSRGRAHLNANEHDEARVQFALSAELGWNGKETLSNIASSLAEHGLFDDAIAYLDRARAIDPEYRLALHNAAKVYIQLGQPEQALLALDDLVRLDGDTPTTLRLMASCMTKIGWNDEAIARLELLLTQEPEDATALRDLGYLYYNHRHDVRKATALFRESLRLDPDQPDLAAILMEPAKTPDLPQLSAEGLMPKAVLPPMPTAPRPPLPTPPVAAPGPVLP